MCFMETFAREKRTGKEIQRNLEARVDSQNCAINDKYRAEIDLFLHRVSSLHEQFNHLSNRCSHAEESIMILKYMMDKSNNVVPSSSSAKHTEGDAKPEESTARQISHIEIY